MADDDVQVVVAAVRTALPEDWASWPGGWPDQIEAALVDAVLSIRAQYGQEDNGVRGAVARWKAHRGSDRPDDLTVLAATDVATLTGIVGRQKLSGGASKAAAIVEAAQNLLAVGVRRAADLDARSVVHKDAYELVKGLGPVTWTYFHMLLGKPGVKPDTWILRFLREALGRPVGTDEARELVAKAAVELRVDETTLDHAIWSHRRSLP